MQIQPFQVLERKQEIHASYLLEASAGTGKTYSIENIVVRLLIDEKNPCTLENILVVTFTKAATADLKARIRQSIQKALLILQSHQSDGAADYLIEVLEKEEATHYAKKQLEEALACFEQAPVFTIHGFCHRMLKEFLFEADVSASLSDGEGVIAPSLYAQLIKDFFRVGVTEDLISCGQLKHLLNHCKGVEGLEKELYTLVTKGIAIAPVPLISEVLPQFCQAMHCVKKKLKVTPQQILEDFFLQAPFYTGICNLQKKPKEENVAKVARFAALLGKESWSLADFDILIADGLYLAEALTFSNLGKKKQPPSMDLLHCPDLISCLVDQLEPCIKNARNPDFILAALAFKCRELIQAYLLRKEIIGFDDLLSYMDKAVQQPAFAAKVRQRFTTAIIDEFQDTDPIQWRIFKSIFLEGDPKACRIYLVGDPKQSIYGFRQADIYTYLSAGNALGSNSRASLDTNYRSSEPLINTLNVLFSSENVPGLIALPLLKETLPYRPVKSGGQIMPKLFADNRGVVHFFSYEEKEEGKGKKLIEAEESFFLPFIANELLQLKAQGISLNSCAVLVADRFQGARLAEHLDGNEIPFVAQRAESLVETLAFGALKELLQAIVTPQNESALKIALGGPLLGWSQSEILALTDTQALEALISKGMVLLKIWRERGFSAFYNAFLMSAWSKTGKTVGEDLLLREGGLDLYQGMQQLAEFLIEKEMSEKLPPFRLIRTLDELLQMDEDGDPVSKLRSNPEKEGVRILTIHSSKGLEFEIVFALGVLRRSKKPSAFIPVVQDHLPAMLTPIDDETDPRYIEYLLENDAEKIRQLYVAFTRAKQRLYVPLFFEGSKKACKMGVASPSELYLAVLGQPEIPFMEIYQRIPALNQKASLEVINQLAAQVSITCSTLDESHDWNKTAKADVGAENEPTLKAPPNCIVPGKPLYMHSFTSLAKNTFPSYPPQDEVKPPSDFDCSDKSAHTLPAGSATGSLLHTLLEMIPFSIASYGKRSHQLLAFVDRHVSKTPLKEWREVIADILYRSLTVPLLGEGSIFSLQHLTDERCYREHEFVYSITQAFHPEFESHPGFLKGVIDLIFEFDGKICILDWKSNWLGPDGSCYGVPEMERAMFEHDYYLQAEIYQEALKRYLRLTDDRPFEEIFGGVFYLFLRGLDKGGVVQI